MLEVEGPGSTGVAASSLSMPCRLDEQGRDVCNHGSSPRLQVPIARKTQDKHAPKAVHNSSLIYLFFVDCLMKQFSFVAAFDHMVEQLTPLCQAGVRASETVWRSLL